MTLLPGEKILRDAAPRGIILTTHRIRFEKKGIISSQFVSIMLEELTSCALIHTSNPILLLVAGLCIFIGYLIETNFTIGAYPIISGVNVKPLTFGYLAALFLMFVYVMTFRRTMEFASAGATIKKSIRFMGSETAKKLIDEIEDAKNRRYLFDQESERYKLGSEAE